MNIVINKLSLDVNKSGSQANIVAKKGDILSRAVLINFHKNGNIYNVEDGNTAIIRAKKPDGTVIYNNATVEDGKVYFVFTSQYCAAVGKVLLEVQLLDSDNNVLYTPRFMLVVENNLYNDSEIESTNEYTQLTESINQAQSAIATAQALSLIKYVSTLPTTGDSKYLYILYDTEELFTLNGLPDEFKTEEAYEEWKETLGEDAQATMFATTDPEHPFILFEGVGVKVETYANPGMYVVTSIWSGANQPVEYVYNANTKQWVAEAPVTGVSVGDNLIKGELYTGSDSSWEGYYVIDDSFEASFAKLYGYLWGIGEFTMVNRLNTVTYTESDNLFDIYDGVDLPLPYGVPYVYDSSFNQYIEVTDADLKNRVITLESTVDNIEEDIVSINDAIDDINDDLEALELNKQDKLTAADGIDITNNIITTKDLFEVRYYKQSGSWKCDKTGQSILDAINAGKKLVVYVNETPSYTYSGTAFYNKGTTSGYNYLDIEFCNPNANGLTKFAISHYVPTGSGTETIDITKAIINTQKSLTAGDGISISGTTISTKDIFELTFTKSSSAWTCDKTSAEIKSAYNSNKKFIFYIINEGTSKIMASGYYDITTPVSNVYILNAYLSTVDSAYFNFYGISYTMPAGSSETISVTVTRKQYQDKLTAGNNVNINNNVISATDTTYTGGNGISIVSNVISSNTVFVTYILNFQTNECTCDKTYNEILSAFTSNKTVIPLIKDIIESSAYRYRLFPGEIMYYSDMFDIEFNIFTMTTTHGIKLKKVNVVHSYDSDESTDIINAGYNDLYGEKYTSVTGIDITNNAIGISEEIQDTIKANTMIGTSSGSISTFTDGVDLPLNKLVVEIEDDTNRSYFQGLLNGTYGFVDIGTLEWSRYIFPGDIPIFYYNLIGRKPGVIKAVCSELLVLENATNVSSMNNGEISLSIGQTNEYIYVRYDSYTTPKDFETAMNGVYLIYELETPTTPTITDAEYQILLNAFGVGVSECNVTRTGKNVAQLTYETKMPSINNGEMVSTYGWSSQFITIEKSLNYCFSINENPTTKEYYILYYDKDKNYLGFSIKPTYTGYLLNTSPYWEDTKYIKLRLADTSESSLRIQIEVGSRATTYEAYNGHTYNIQFPSGVTISNGSIDILNGVLTDDDLSEEYNITPIAIRSLNGVNNVFADTGDIKECEYTRDATIIINELIARIAELES